MKKNRIIGLITGVFVLVILNQCNMENTKEMQTVDQDVFITKEVNLSYDSAVVQLKENLKNVGFGVITEVDMHEKLKEKLDVDVPRYKILGVCNPAFAHKAMQVEENIGVFLPCKVVVKELDDNRSKIIAGNTEMMMQSIGKEDLTVIASEVGETIEKVIANME